MIQGLTSPGKSESRASSDPSAREIVFSGSFEAVNEHFYEEQWGDGLPIVPPTIDKSNCGA